jgi:hypothetical protein
MGQVTFTVSQSQGLPDITDCSPSVFQSYVCSLLEMAASGQNKLSSSLDFAASFKTFMLSHNLHEPGVACPEDEDLDLCMHQLITVLALCEA